MVRIKKIKLPVRIKHSILALGSQNKNTVCFAEGNYAYLSQVHPDLDNLKDFFDFEQCARYFLKRKPKIIAYDLHPEYQSTKYAKQLSVIPARAAGGRQASRGYRLSAIQHHHAHIASCMAENGLKNQKVIGVSFDGTGYGSDNTLWGAEFFICDYGKFKRRAHLREVMLLGGRQAIIEPWRLTAAWLYSMYGDGFLKLNINFSGRINKKKWKVLKSMYLQGLNSPLASSMGRLFDAAASLILLKFQAKFEAELAIELQNLAAGYPLARGRSACQSGRQEFSVSSYKFKIMRKGGVYIIDPAPMFEEIVADLKTGKMKNKVAYRFHLTAAQIIRKGCLSLRKEANINKVVLSGGVFQNKLLLSLSLDLLRKEGFDVFMPDKLPCSDSGVSLGQAIVASFNH